MANLLLPGALFYTRPGQVVGWGREMEMPDREWGMTEFGVRQVDIFPMSMADQAMNCGALFSGWGGERWQEQGRDA